MGLANSWTTAKKTFEKDAGEKKPGGETGIEAALKGYDKYFDKVYDPKTVGSAKLKAYDDFLVAFKPAHEKLTKYSLTLKVVAKRGVAKYDNAVTALETSVGHVLYMTDSGRKTLKEKFHFAK